MSIINKFSDSIEKYIIHLEKSTDRKEIIDNIIKITGAKIFKAISHKQGEIGCYLSHLEIYKQNLNKSVLIFEDDCEIIDPNLLNIIDKFHTEFDIIYLGTNCLWFGDDKWSKIDRKIDITKTKGVFSYGTHAMYLSSKARKIFVEYVKDKPYSIPIDQLWNLIQDKYDLRVWRHHDIYKFCKQKTGIKSVITNKIREDYYYK